MKLICILLFFACTKCFSQTFGKASVTIYPSPIQEDEMAYYKWYTHPEEENIYIISFERNLDGLITAFTEVEKLLSENDLEFEEPITDLSSFHHSLDSSHTFEELHHSVKKEQSKIFRTWNSGKDYLTLLLKHDIYMLILGNPKTQ